MPIIDSESMNLFGVCILMLSFTTLNVFIKNEIRNKKKEMSMRA